MQEQEEKQRLRPGDPAFKEQGEEERQACEGDQKGGTRVLEKKQNRTKGGSGQRGQMQQENQVT